MTRGNKDKDLEKALEHIREAELILKKYDKNKEISLINEYVIKAGMLIRSLWRDS